MIIDNFELLLIDSSFFDRVASLESFVENQSNLPPVVSTLDTISDDLGDIRAGRILVSEEGGEPTDSAFDGTFISSNGITFDGDQYHIGGVEDGDLQWGGNSANGKFVFGAGEVIADREGLTIGATGTQILIDAATKVLKSSNYSPGVSGYQIEASGEAEFENVIVRGEIRSAVFGYEEVQGTAGTLMITKSAGKLKTSVTTVASPTTVNIDIEDPTYGHVQLFAVDDILRLKNGADDSWVSVSSVSDQTTYYRYVCVLESGSTATYEAGLAVIDYGASGDGFLVLTADATNAPFYSVRFHLGEPWDDTREVIRIGNLNGFFDYDSDVYGLGVGGGDTYLVYDEDSGMRMKASLSIAQVNPYGFDHVMEQLTGDIDGVNTTFRPQHNIYQVGGVPSAVVVHNGLWLFAGGDIINGQDSDFTVDSPDNCYMNTAPVAGDVFRTSFTKYGTGEIIADGTVTVTGNWLENAQGAHEYGTFILNQNGLTPSPIIDYVSEYSEVVINGGSYPIPVSGDELYICYKSLPDRDWIYHEWLGSPDGSETEFTTAHDVIDDEIEVIQNGLRLIQDTDYTITNGDTVTFDVAPLTGDLIWCCYKTDYYRNRGW